jgi:hypothetical protein
VTTPKKFIFDFLLFCIGLVVVGFGVTCILSIPRQYLRAAGQGRVPDWEDFYRQPTNSVDLLFFGSSRSYNAFNPKIFEDMIGIKAYNLGSQFQPPLVTYFALQEALKTQHPKVIVLETYWLTWEDQNLTESFFAAFPYMKLSANKIKFLAASKQYEQAPFLLPIEPWQDGLFAVPKLLSNDFKRVNVYKGYRENEGTLVPMYGEGIPTSTVHLETDSDPKQLRYLAGVLALAKAEHIKVVLVTSPTRHDRLQTITNYSDIHNYVKKLADEAEVEYFDYIQSRPDYPVFKEADFYDSAHLNSQGSSKLSQDLARRIKNEFTVSDEK